MFPKDNPDSWRRIHEFIAEFPDDVNWRQWKEIAGATISALEAKGLASSFRVGQSMHHILFSTLGHHQLTTEPRVTLELQPTAMKVRVAYSCSNLYFNEPISEETFSVESSIPGVLRNLRRLWEETKGETPLPEGLRLV